MILEIKGFKDDHALLTLLNLSLDIFLLALQNHFLKAQKYFYSSVCARHGGLRIVYGS